MVRRWQGILTRKLIRKRDHYLRFIARVQTVTRIAGIPDRWCVVGLITRVLSCSSTLARNHKLGITNSVSTISYLSLTPSHLFYLLSLLLHPIGSVVGSPLGSVVLISSSRLCGAVCRRVPSSRTTRRSRSAGSTSLLCIHLSIVCSPLSGRILTWKKIS